MDQNRTTLSLIVPYYNRQDLLNEMLETIPDIDGVEVILVNDHSTEDVVVQWDKTRSVLRTIDNAEGQKFAGTARNEGLKVASGEWIAFMDSDDLFYQKGLRDLVERLRDLAEHEGPDVVYFYGDGFRSDGSEGRRHIPTNWSVWKFDQTGATDHLIFRVQPPGQAIRRKFVQDNQLSFGEERCSEDVIFNTQLHLANPLRAVIPVSVHRIREGHESIMSSVELDAVITHISVLKRSNEMLKDAGVGNLQMPVFVHALKLFKINKWLAVKELIESAINRQPVFLTKQYLLRRLIMRRDIRSEAIPSRVLSAKGAN